MKINVQIVSIIAFLILSGPVLSQKTWTLEDCIDHALEHNLQLNDFEYNVESSRETYRQSFRNLLPSVRGISDYGIRFGRSVDPNDNSISDTQFFINNYSLQGSLELFQGFQKQNAIKASKLIYRATQEETLQQKYLLAFRVMQAFYDIQFFEGALTIAKEQKEISQTNFDLVKKQIELGRMAGADLYEAESILLTDKLSVTRAQNDLQAAQLALIQEMNLEGTTTISIVTEVAEKIKDDDTYAVRSDSIFKEAKNFIPIIKARELRAKAARKQLAVERGNFYPSLTLLGEYGTGYFETITDSLGVTLPFRDQFRDNSFQFVGLSLNVPIFSGWSNRSRVKQQKIALMRAKNDLATQEQELFQTIQDLVQQYHAIRAEYKQTVKNMEAQNLAFTIAQKRYEKGMINAIDLFTAKNLFASAQNQNLQVRLRAEVNKSTLDFYKGLPVFAIKPYTSSGFGKGN